MGTYGLRVERFSGFAELVRTASGGPSDHKVVDQVRYIESYLRAAEPSPAKCIIVEHPYVDRHWLEEYSGYYATLLDPPSTKTTRLHFLSLPYKEGLLDDLIEQVIEDPKVAAEHVTAHYLGYVVVRPLASTPIGRTVLRPYQGNDQRCYAPADMVNLVHLLGLRIALPGLPFQQQDTAAGACATAAIWSALAKVMRTDGQRPATPLAITHSATAHRVQARALPAGAGLDLDQMATAIRNAGYQPHVFRCEEDAQIFLLALKTYLCSGIPVVVRVAGGGLDFHAVTLAGFRSSDEDVVEIQQGARSLRFGAITRFYVHDDRLGPYARLDHRSEEGGQYQFVLRPREPGYDGHEEPMHFAHAIVPLYPKLRMTAEELIKVAIDLLPLMGSIAGERRDALRVVPRFQLGGDYLRDVMGTAIQRSRKRKLATSVLLSRYVGCVRFEGGAGWWCDVLVDTTDIQRDNLSAKPFLAVIPSDESLCDRIEGFRSYLGPRPVVS